MKKILLAACIAISGLAAGAQNTTKVIPVSGNCGMCEANIEKAAKSAGATFADWNKNSKHLTVKYNAGTTNALQIEQAIAASGYDTKNVKADEAAYKKLHECCQYNRTAKYGRKPAKGGAMDDCCAKMKDGKKGDKNCKKSSDAACKKSGGDCCSKK